MVTKQKILWVALLFIMILSACAPTTMITDGQPDSQGQNSQAPSGGLVVKDKAPFAIAAKTALSQKLKIAEDQVSFVSAELVDWSDSCLGLGGPAESCLQAITPGYKVILNAQGSSYEVHTNETGSVVRIKE
jgi:hypothetical protein